MYPKICRFLHEYVPRLYAWLYASACIGTMHIHAHMKPACVCKYPKLGMFLHVSARIKSWGCICICCPLSSDECISCICWPASRGASVNICIHWLVLRARSTYQVSACTCKHKELSVCLHVPVRIECWACLCMCLHTSKASMCHRALACSSMFKHTQTHARALACCLCVCPCWNTCKHTQTHTPEK